MGKTKDEKKEKKNRQKLAENLNNQMKIPKKDLKIILVNSKIKNNEDLKCQTDEKDIFKKHK